MQNIHPNSSRYWILLFVILACRAQALAQTQQKKPQPTIFAGQISHHFDYFWTNNWLYADAIYKRPQFLNRLSINLQLAKGKFDMPVQIMLTAPYNNADRNLIYPNNFEEYLLMPGNVLGMQPSYRKLKLLLGSHTANLSPLTAGNIAFSPEAGGFEFTPGRFCIKASYGLTHRLIAFAGQLQRRMLTAQFGFGNDAKSHIMLNFVRARDLGPGQQNALLSLKYQLQGDEHLYWRGEIALSSPAIAPTLGAPLDIGATESEIGLRFKHWNFALGGKYVGPNFRTLAYFNQNSGYLDITSSLRFQLAKSKLQVSGTGGFRRSGIAVPVEVSDQAIVNASGHLQLTPRLGFDAHYYNYAWQQPIWEFPIPSNPPAAITQTSASLGGSTHLRLGNKRSHIFTGNFSQDNYAVQNTINHFQPGPTAIQATSVGANYQRINRKHHGFTLGGYQFAYAGAAPVWPYYQSPWNAYTGLQRYFFKTRLQVLGQFQYSLGDVKDPGNWDMLLATLTASTKFFKKRLQYTCEANARLQAQPAGNIRMFFMRHALQYQF